MGDRILTIENLKLSFPVFQGNVNVLNNVSMHINRGEIVGVVGESGSGKSVTAMLSMRLIPQGTYQVSNGKLEVMGRDVLHANEAEMREMRGDKVAMIFQEPMTALNPTRRIGKQMMDVIRQHRSLSQKQAKERAVELLGDMQIADPRNVMERYPFELSGGMRQRVMIALAFSCDPDLLIADEPTTALDVTVQRQVLRLLKQKARSTGTAVLFISHDMAVISQVCDRLYVMYAGSVIESGETDAVLTKPFHPYSAGLLECSPEGSEPRTELASIPGTVPNLAKLPSGCSFRERCFAAGKDCQNIPQLQPFGYAERQVACWYPQQENVNV
ncbi:ABC transporter ATP-binding protein [Pluralibacter gergoviae]